MARALNATAASLLGFLHEGPQSGYDLVQTAERSIGDFWSLTRSQVYRELAAMADAGLVVAQEAGARDRRAFAVTDEGRAAFRDWLSRPPAEEQVRYPLLLVLAFAEHLPQGAVAEFVVQHRAAHAARLEGYRRQRDEALAAGARPVDLVTLDFGLRYEEAVLGWFDALPPEVREG